MRIYSIIPARSGSKGVPNKNIRLLTEFELIAYSIASALLSKRIERVVVSTDSEKIANIARSYGAEVPFLRPEELARDESTDREFVIHALEWFLQNEGFVPDYLVHLRPTTPLRDPQLIDVAIETILSHPEATSLRSAHEAPESPLKWFKLNDKGYFEGLLSEDPRPEYYNLPRQNFPSVYIPNGYVDILKTDFVLNSESLHGDRMLGFLTPVVTEADAIEDFHFLEYEIKKYGHSLLDYLRSH
ncbi:MAG: acylneuraminate cytidylyltransferase family protein [Candidatus Hodarchaeales archaeon]